MVRYFAIGAGLVCLSVAAGVALVLGHDAASGQRRLASLAPAVQPEPAVRRDAKAAAALPGTSAKSVSLQAVQSAVSEPAAPSSCCAEPLERQAPGSVPQRRGAGAAVSRPAAQEPDLQPVHRQTQATEPGTVTVAGAQPAPVSLPPQLQRRETQSALPGFFIGVFR